MVHVLYWLKNNRKDKAFVCLKSNYSIFPGCSNKFWKSTFLSSKCFKTCFIFSVWFRTILFVELVLYNYISPLLELPILNFLPLLKLVIYLLHLLLNIYMTCEKFNDSLKLKSLLAFWMPPCLLYHDCNPPARLACEGVW